MNDNRLPLTRNYCSSAKEKLIFHPETIDEAKFVAEQLNWMGFCFYKEEYRDQMAAAATGSIVPIMVLMGVFTASALVAAIVAPEWTGRDLTDPRAAM